MCGPVPWELGTLCHRPRFTEMLNVLSLDTQPLSSWLGAGTTSAVTSCNELDHAPRDLMHAYATLGIQRGYVHSFPAFGFVVVQIVTCLSLRHSRTDTRLGRSCQSCTKAKATTHPSFTTAGTVWSWNILCKVSCITICAMVNFPSPLFSLGNQYTTIVTAGYLLPMLTSF